MIHFEGLGGLLIVLSWWVGTIMEVGGGIGFTGCKTSKSVMCIRSILAISIDSGCFLASYWLCMGLFHQHLHPATGAARRSRNLLLQLHSSIGSVFLEQFCSRWPSLPTDYLLFEVRGMSSPKSVHLCGLFVWCPDKSYPNISFSTLICQGMVNYSICTSDNCVITILPFKLRQAFWNFPRFYGGRISTNSQHPTVIHSQSVVPDVQRHWFGPQITLKSPVKCKDESGCSWFFYIFLLIWSLHFILSIPMNVVMSHNNIQHLPYCNLVSSLWLA